MIGSKRKTVKQPYHSIQLVDLLKQVVALNLNVHLNLTPGAFKKVIFRV